MKTLQEEINRELEACEYFGAKSALADIIYGAVSASQLQTLRDKIDAKHFNQRTLAEKAMAEGRNEDAAFHQGLAWAYTVTGIDIDNLMNAAKGNE